MKITSGTSRPARYNPPMTDAMPACQHPGPGFFDSATGRYEGVQLFPPVMLPMYGEPPIMPPLPQEAPTAAVVSTSTALQNCEAPSASAGWFRGLVDRFRRFMQRALQEVFQWPEGW